MAQQISVVGVGDAPAASQPKRAPFTNTELMQFAQDPDYTPADLNLLSAEEMARLQTIQDRKSPTGVVKDMLTGVGKGAGDTAFNLGKAVHSLPLVGKFTDMVAKLVGPDAYHIGQGAVDAGKTDPDAAFAKPPQQLEAENTAQQVGKTAEQVGEYFVPANATRSAVQAGLMKLIPEAASPRAVAVANKVIEYASRVIGEGASGSGVATAQGDEHPARAGAIAAGTTVSVEGLGAITRALLRTQIGKEIAPVLLASGVMSGIGGLVAGIPGAVGGGSLGASMGMYGVAKRAASAVLEGAPKLDVTAATHAAENAAAKMALARESVKEAIRVGNAPKIVLAKSALRDAVATSTAAKAAAAAAMGAKQFSSKSSAAPPEAMMGLGSKLGELGAGVEGVNDTKRPNLRRRRIEEMMQP